MNIVDGGAPPLSESTNVTFTVTDINEFTPRFSAEEYFAMAVSSSPPNTPLLRVLATDDDGEDNAITYSIINRDENGVSFSVDSEGGITNDDPLTMAPAVSGPILAMMFFVTTKCSARLQAFSPFHFYMLLVKNGCGLVELGESGHGKRLLYT